MEAKGKSYLKIIGVLMIIFGTISTLMYLLIIIGGGALLTGVSGSVGEGVALSGLLFIVFVIALLWSVLEIVAGVVGVKHCKNPEKADICFKLGAVLIVLSLISSIGQMVQQGFSFSGIVSMAIGLLLPALFCYGAKLNQQ